MAWWSTAWDRLRPSVSRDAKTDIRSAALPGPTPAPATTSLRRTDWTTSAPMPRAIDPHPLIAPLDPFTMALPTQRSPAFLAPLEHVVSPDGGGVVDGLATVAHDVTDFPSVPLAASNPAPAITTPAVVQRRAIEPDLVLSEVSPAAAAPARARALPSTAPSSVGATGDSLVRAPDPAPLRDLPVVARPVDPTGDATPTTRPAPSAPHRLEPRQSAASPDLPVVSRSLADPACAPDLHGVAPFLGMTTTPRAPQQISSPEESPRGAVPADRADVGPSRVTPLSSAVTAVQRNADAGPVLAPSASLPPRRTFGLGAPLNDVDSAPAEPAPVAVGFAAFPFGDASADADRGRTDFPWPATVVARSAADAPGTAPAATDGGDGDRPWSGPEAGPLTVTPLPAAPPAPVPAAQRSVATDSTATGWSRVAAGPPPSATDLPIAGVRLPTVTLPTAWPVVTAGSVTAGGSAGEAAVRAGVAQRAIDGSYVFAPPVPSSPVGATGLPATPVPPPVAVTAAVSPTGAGALLLRSTSPASETAVSTVPVAQRLWGSDALNPGAPMDQARDAVPTLPTPALPNPTLPTALPQLLDAPSIPALPSLPALPTVPTVPVVPGLPSTPSVPGLPSMPGVAGLPTVPALPSVPEPPTLPAVADGWSALPGVPSLPLPPTVPTLAGPTLPTPSALPSVPSMPSFPAVSGSGLPGVPAASTFPSPGAGPASWPVGSGGGVDHPLPVTPLDRVINSTVPGSDSGASRRVDHPVPGEAERVINSTVSAAGTAPAPEPEPPTPPTAAPASSGTPSGAGPAAVALAAAGASGGAAAAAAAAPGLDIDELARRLIDPLSARLRTELWLDRERAGLLTDL